MKRLLLALFIVFGLASFSNAGEIHGTIYYKDKAVAKGIKVEATAGEFIDSTHTNKYGGYSIIVNGQGVCSLAVFYPSKIKYKENRGVACNDCPSPPIIEAYRFKRKSIVYDLILTRKGNGEYNLKKK